MSDRRAPWWVFVLAAAYLSYFGLLLYCSVVLPQPLAAEISFTPTGMWLEEVPPDSPAGRAGLRSGDQVEEADGRRIRTRGDWTVVETNLRLDEPIRVVVRRQDTRVVRDVWIGPDPVPTWRTEAGLVLLTVRLAQALTLMLALLIAVKRPYDGLARLCAWMLASGSVLSIAPPFRFAAVWRSLGPAGMLLWVPFVSSLAVGAILFTFFLRFPRPLVGQRWILAAAWAPIVAVLAWFVPGYVSVVYQPQLASGAPGMLPILVATVAYSAAGLTVLLLNYRRLDDVADRRRLHVIVPGLVVAVSGFALLVALRDRLPLDPTGPLYASPVIAIGTFMALALPVSLTYAILRHRVFDLGTLLRMGVRYALARRAVLLIVPVLVGVLVADLVLRGERSIGDFVAGRATTYVILIGLALYAHAHRERWLAGLDRRFFREQYNAQHLMRQVTADLRTAGNIDTVAPSIVAHIETALQPHFVALMLRSAHDSSFHPLACAPAGAAPLPLSDASRIVSLTRVLGSPIVVGGDGEGGLNRYFSADERSLGGADADLVVPVTVGPDRLEVLLVLGAKRSEEPYSTEDLDLLSGLADALALVVERPRRAAAPGVLLEECPDCGRCYDAGTETCVEDRAGLMPTRVERVLVDRYHLNQRLGRGGMGTVYEALDVALQRAVAVKLTLEEWTQASGGADRFRREALIAASFAHPNVVTVYDFGVTDHDRAFLVMERLRGTDLRHELRRLERLPTSRTSAVLRGVCAAVGAAHRDNLVHRDLKPENLFLARVEGEEVVKVLDFGLARLTPGPAEETTTSGIVLGTPPYMSPEQLRHGRPDRTWDIWALGVIAYELLTGALPFSTGAVTSSTIPVGESSAPVWPAPLASRLHGHLEPFRPFFACALAIDPHARPASAHEFFRAFEDAVRASEELTRAAP